MYAVCRVFGIGELEMYETLFNLANTFLPMMLVICQTCFLLAGVNHRKPKGGSRPMYSEQGIKSMCLFRMGELLPNYLLFVEMVWFKLLSSIPIFL
jgi:hypothetical protein